MRSFVRSPTARRLHDAEGLTVGALIMLGTLFGLVVLIFALVLRYDPEARRPSKSRRSENV
jgi:hypothetical protein